VLILAGQEHQRRLRQLEPPPPRAGHLSRSAADQVGVSTLGETRSRRQAWRLVNDS